MFKISEPELIKKINLRSGLDIVLFVLMVLVILILTLWSSFTRVELTVAFSIMCIFYFVRLLHTFLKNNTSISYFYRQQMTYEIGKTDKITRTIKLQKDKLKSEEKLLEDIKNFYSNLKFKVIDAKEKSIKLQNCSIKGTEAIENNGSKLTDLNQKIGLISELILELLSHIRQVEDILGIVDEISEQTNMLALNAAVEAARAGEHGKGFAVVAGEIRKLADESKQSITKITSLVKEIKVSTDSVVKVAEEGVNGTEVLTENIGEMASNIKGVSESVNLILNFIDELVSDFSANDNFSDKLDKVIDSIIECSDQFELLVKDNSVANSFYTKVISEVEK